MRLTQELVSAGYFWLPAHPERKVPGTLRITDGGDIELEIISLFDQSVQGIASVFNGSMSLGRILGEIANHGAVTLEKCAYKSVNGRFGSGSEIAMSTVRANIALVGVWFDGAEAVFNGLEFSVEGIDEWVGLTGIRVQHQEKTATINYSPPPEISVALQNGMTLLITFSWTLPGYARSFEASISQQAQFKLVAESPIPLDDFIFVAHKITTFLCFAIDETVCIQRVIATSANVLEDYGNGVERQLPISVFYPSIPFVREKEDISRRKMLFAYPQIRANWSVIINAWLSAYEVIDPALNLYFAARTGAHKYLESKFLALAQALETFHRRTSNATLMDNETFGTLVKHILDHCPEDRKEWLTSRLTHGNEISLASRLKAIVNDFGEAVGNPKDITKLVRRIVDTRNYLTHFDEALKALAARGKDMWVLCQKMEALLQLHLLQKIGFSKDEIKSILSGTSSLSTKLSAS